MNLQLFFVIFVIFVKIIVLFVVNLMLVFNHKGHKVPRKDHKDIIV